MRQPTNWQIWRCGFDVRIPLKLTNPRLPGQAGVRILDVPLRTALPELHFSELLIETNLVLSFAPSPFTTAMMASELALLPGRLKPRLNRATRWG